MGVVRVRNNDVLVFYVEGNGTYTYTPTQTCTTWELSNDGVSDLVVNVDSMSNLNPKVKSKEVAKFTAPPFKTITVTGTGQYRLACYRSDI